MFLAEQLHQKANHSRLVRSAKQLLEWELILRCTKPFTQLACPSHLERRGRFRAIPPPIRACRIHRPSACQAAPCPTRCHIGTTHSPARGHRSPDLAQSVYAVGRRRLVPSAQRLAFNFRNLGPASSWPSARQRGRSAFRGPLNGEV
eukprot:scaffold4051_cov68-Phaeocystis_antarctica.AAC.8